MCTIDKTNHNSKFNTISYRNEYRPNDAIIIKTEQEQEVAAIIYIFEIQDEIMLNVRKFIFARNLKKIFKKQGEKFDDKNEVVGDFSKTYQINIKQILQKCALNLTSDESPFYREENLKYDFFCRFGIKGNQLFPIIPLKNTSFSSEANTAAGTENTPVSNVHNPIIKYSDEEASPPPHRNSVKRNLNKSFGNSPSSNKSILNYSVISLSDSEDDNKMVIKLKVSKRQNGQTTKSLVTSPPKIRKSNRSVTRKSYADFISPVKSSPSKRRTRRDSDNVDEMQNLVMTSTPSKQSKRENSTSKRQISTPKTYYELSSCRRTPGSTPARRSLRLSSTDCNKTPKRSVRSTRKDISYAEKDSPVMINLDDSLRRNILKVNLSKVNGPENENDAKDNKKQFNHEQDAKSLSINLSNLNLSNEGKENNGNTVINTSDSCSDCSDEGIGRKSKSKNVVHTPKRNRQSSTITPTKTSKSPVNETPRSIKVDTSKTPRNRAKLIREGIVTPSMHERNEKIKDNSTPLMKARSQLHVSYVPESLPCREKEYWDIHNFVESKLLDGCGGCMYISGVPGTGKTATVTSVISTLQESKDIPKFTFVNVNGMRLTEPRQSYVEILKQLNGKSLSWEQAQNTLEDMFIKQKKMAPIVMLIDELDILCTKRQDVVYNLLDWPTKAKSQLIAITIANTMDLPERLLMNRVTSRLGLTRLTFQAYTFKQLQEIVTKRLWGTDSFNPDAVQFVARKVASVSGDARRALDICRRAAEIAELEGKVQFVNMTHVNGALNAMFTQPKVLAIKSCSKLEKLILQSIVAEVERTGIEETTFCEVYKMLITCASIEGFKMVSQTLAHCAVSRLSACRLIIADQKCSNIHQKIILNVSNDDVYYALKQN